MPKVNLKDFFSDKAQIKYCCAKNAIALSQEKPEVLYPDFDFFLQFLDGENHVLKWTAIIIIGNLSKADKKNKVEKIIPKFIGFLNEKEMITANNTIKALVKIIEARPKIKNKILKEVIKVEKYKYYNKGELSPECRNITIGHAIDALSEFKDDIKNKKEFINFIKRQTKNTRQTVRKRADNLFKKINK